MNLITAIAITKLYSTDLAGCACEIISLIDRQSPLTLADAESITNSILAGDRPLDRPAEPVALAWRLIDLALTTSCDLVNELQSALTNRRCIQCLPSGAKGANDAIY